jgi:hypothetical protein
MKLEKWAQTAEIVAAVAVVVSIVYLGREVESNTSAVQGTAMQAIASTDAQILMSVASDAELSEIVRVGYQTPGQLSEAELFRFSMFMRQFWLSFQNIYQQSELELIEQSVWESYRTVICGMWARPGSRETWSTHVDILDAGFVAVVQACE